jgi:hypothetical protein
MFSDQVVKDREVESKEGFKHRKRQEGISEEEWEKIRKREKGRWREELRERQSDLEFVWNVPALLVYLLLFS